ncbi:MAG TPA: hypothetical protein VK797_08455 [Tepidisphaeraceae bacterium]|nr:hypothetical protein [Tepidisphaeraceae bacterium]
MPGFVAILEDNLVRIAEMRACLAEALPAASGIVFENAFEMIENPQSPRRFASACPSRLMTWSYMRAELAGSQDGQRCMILRSGSRGEMGRNCYEADLPGRGCLGGFVF